jgi:hypothetical protein
MPCNSRITQAVCEGNLNVDVLIGAGQSLGYEVVREGSAICIRDKRAGQGWHVVYSDGKLTAVDWYGNIVPAEMVSKVKRAYAAQAVRIAAKRCGWSVSSSVTAPNKLTLSR